VEGGGGGERKGSRTLPRLQQLETEFDWLVTHYHAPFYTLKRGGGGEVYRREGKKGEGKRERKGKLFETLLTASLIGAEALITAPGLTSSAKDVSMSGKKGEGSMRHAFRALARFGKKSLFHGAVAAAS